jgi:predicted metal-dependent peptidase
MARKKGQPARDLAAENFERGVQLLRAHPIFAPLLAHSTVVRQEGNLCPKDGWAVVTRAGALHVHPTRRGEPGEWMYVLAHCLLHLGFGHFQQGRRPREWNAACDLFVARFLADLKLGRAPEDTQVNTAFAARNEERLYAELCETDLGEHFPTQGTAGPRAGDMVWGPEQTDWQGRRFDWQLCFGLGLAEAVTDAVNVAGGQAPGRPGWRTAAQRAREWFINTYPLLGALAAGFTIIEDTQICHRLSISVAAVNAERREIFMNPAAGLDERECRFVMAHELLHVGLRHHARCQGRDPFLWNISCDYVINAWLVEMGVGTMPRMGLLYDASLKGESAEAIYDRIVTDMRRYRKLGTLRGFGLGDMLEPETPDWWSRGDGMDLDEFYRRALSQGLSYHQDGGRGFLPAGLVEEIRALSQPPIPWDVELAQWFDRHFAPPEKIRSYARISRRQSATPDIPRPRWVYAPGALDGRTFGVLLDTSGSMDRSLLAKALGTIASYSIARDVPAARVVFCDADAYDQGYMPPDAIADRVQVRGRGGTVLQPGIDLLESATDFPQDGPLLIITDGQCDRLHIRREHAFLLPEGRYLPFVPRGEVFRIR